MGRVEFFILLAFLFQAESADSQGKDLSLFNVVKFKNDICIGNTGSRNGTCYTTEECEERNGIPQGSCAEGYGVCCIIELSCGAMSSENCTYLTQARTTKPGDFCSYKICPSSKAICRMKYEFSKFNIAGPVSADVATTNEGATGDCVDDSFSVSGGGVHGSPMICGINTGQHVFVDVSNTLCSVATFVFGASTTISREYDIKVIQYDCNDEMGGPPGCLQYFTGSSGTIASFNYPINSASIVTEGEGQVTHLSDQAYAICIRRASGMCSICYVPSIRSTIASKNSYGLSLSAITTKATHDTDCSSDYIMIPMAVDTAALANAMTTFTIGKERICGRIFTAIANGQLAISYATISASVCSGARPFRVQVKFDQNERATATTDDTTIEHKVSATVPNGIIGFSLDYRQQAC